MIKKVVSSNLPVDEELAIRKNRILPLHPNCKENVRFTGWQPFRA